MVSKSGNFQLFVTKNKSKFSILEVMSKHREIVRGEAMATPIFLVLFHKIIFKWPKYSRQNLATFETGFVHSDMSFEFPLYIVYQFCVVEK